MESLNTFCFKLFKNLSAGKGKIAFNPKMSKQKQIN